MGVLFSYNTQQSVLFISISVFHRGRKHTDLEILLPNVPPGLLNSPERFFSHPDVVGRENLLNHLDLFVWIVDQPHCDARPADFQYMTQV